MLECSYTALWWRTSNAVSKSETRKCSGKVPHPSASQHAVETRKDPGGDRPRMCKAQGNRSNEQYWRDQLPLGRGLTPGQRASGGGGGGALLLPG